MYNNTWDTSQRTKCSRAMNDLRPSSGTPTNSINNNTINNKIFVIVLEPRGHGTLDARTTHFSFLSLAIRGRGDVLDICLGAETSRKKSHRIIPELRYGPM